MAVKKVEHKETNRFMEVTRKVGLAYIGAFGVAGDEMGKLFEKFVDRGELIQKDARKMARENGKQIRTFAQDMRHEQKAAVAKANKTVKKAVRNVEHAIS